MQNLSYKFSHARIGLCVLLNLGLLMQPMSSSAANSPVVDTRVQALSTIYVEPVAPSANIQIPGLKINVNQLLNSTIRKQLEQEARLQINPNAHALRLIGVILSYNDATLDVQGELFDDDKLLVYSRIKHHIEADDDWNEALNLVVEQMLDELIGEMRDKAQADYGRYFVPNNCYANSRCSDPYYVGWGWWRVAHRYPTHHDRNRSDRDDNRSVDVKRNDQRIHKDSKQHWDAGKPSELRHKEPRAIVETPNKNAPTHSHNVEDHGRHDIEFEAGGVTGKLFRDQSFMTVPSSGKQPTTTVGADMTLSQPTTVQSPVRSHHHDDSAQQVKPGIQPVAIPISPVDATHDVERHHKFPGEAKPVESGQTSPLHSESSAKQTQESTPNTGASPSSTGNSATSVKSSSTGNDTLPATAVTPSKNTVLDPSPASQTGSGSSGSFPRVTVGDTVSSNPASVSSSNATGSSSSQVSAPVSSSKSVETSSSPSDKSSVTYPSASSESSVTPSSSSVSTPSYQSPSSESSPVGGSSSTSSTVSSAPSDTHSSRPVESSSYSSPSSGSSSSSSTSSSSSMPASAPAPISAPAPAPAPAPDPAPEPAPAPASTAKHHDEPGAPH